MLLVVNIISCKKNLSPNHFNKSDLPEFIFHETKVELAFGLTLFSHEILLNDFWRKILCNTLLKMYAKTLLGETLCKFYQIFPPKVLVLI